MGDGQRDIALPKGALRTLEDDHEPIHALGIRDFHALGNRIPVELESRS